MDLRVFVVEDRGGACDEPVVGVFRTLDAVRAHLVLIYPAGFRFWRPDSDPVWWDPGAGPISVLLPEDSEEDEPQAYIHQMEVEG